MRRVSNNYLSSIYASFRALKAYAEEISDPDFIRSMVSQDSETKRFGVFGEDLSYFGKKPEDFFGLEGSGRHERYPQKCYDKIRSQRRSMR